MTTPSAHLLGHPQRYTNGNGLTIFRAECACGLAIHGKRLPALYAAHDEHLGVVKAMGMFRHPSAGGAA